MNIKQLQARLSAFHVLRKPVDGDGDDLGGEVIDAANPAGNDFDAPGPDEDRGAFLARARDAVIRLRDA